MNLKYVNVIIDKEDFVREFVNDVVNSRNSKIKKYETDVVEHKEMLQTNVRSSGSRTLICLGLALMWFATSAEVGYLFILPVLLNLISCLKSYFDLKALKTKSEMNDAILKIDDVVFNMNIEYVRSIDFQELISCEEAHKAQDDILFLHLFYTHEIKSIEYTDDAVIVSYVKDDAIETATLKKFEKKDQSGLYDSISYVRGLLLLGNNGMVMNHATDSKELEEV